MSYGLSNSTGSRQLVIMFCAKLSVLFIHGDVNHELHGSIYMYSTFQTPLLYMLLEILYPLMHMIINQLTLIFST